VVLELLEFREHQVWMAQQVPKVRLDSLEWLDLLVGPEQRDQRDSQDSLVTLEQVVRRGQLAHLGRKVTEEVLALRACLDHREEQDSLVTLEAQVNRVPSEPQAPQVQVV
jgi:hypothetical protein